MVFSGVVNSICVNDLFQYCAVAVHTIPDGFSCRHENVFLFQRQKNGSLTIINLYSLGETSLWAFYWWHCLTGVSYIDFGRFQPRDRWYNPCYIAPKTIASSLLMLAVNFALGAREGGG